MDLGLMNEVLSIGLAEAEKGPSKYSILRYTNDEIVVKLPILGKLSQQTVNFTSDLHIFLEPCLKKANGILHEIFRVPMLIIAILIFILEVSKVLFVQNLPTTVLFLCLSNRLRLLWGSGSLRCIHRGKSINNFNDSILELDLSEFEDLVILDQGKMVAYLQLLTLHCRHLDLYTVLMGDRVVIVFEILEKISGGRFIGH
jgi:hypothetical protein